MLWDAMRLLRGWLSNLLWKPKPTTVGIGLDEPIEVSPGKFVTACALSKNATSPEEMDERLRTEAASNPELAKTLEAHFGWKDGKPGAIPVVTQIADAAQNAAEDENQ